LIFLISGEIYKKYKMAGNYTAEIPENPSENLLKMKILIYLAVRSDASVIVLSKNSKKT